MKTPNNTTYPYLPDGREIKYAPKNNEFMRAAEKVAWMESTDRRMPTGAVIVSGGKVIASASNKAPLTNPTLLNIHKKYFCVRRLFKIRSGEKYWMCPGCAGPENHGESRACKQLSKTDLKANDLDLYLFGHWWCCKDCWDAMIKSNIRDVYLMESSDPLFREKADGNIIGHQLDHLSQK